MSQTTSTMATTIPVGATFYVVPAGARSAQCRGPNCRKLIYFAPNPKTGKSIPIDCDVPGGLRPSDVKDTTQLDILAGGLDVHEGRGISHFITCTDRDYFTKRGAR